MSNHTLLVNWVDLSWIWYISSGLLKTWRLIQETSKEKLFYWSSKDGIYQDLLGKLDTNSTLAWSIKLYEFSISISEYWPMLMYLFKVSFLTTLDIYKTYFKSRHTQIQRPRALFSLWEAISFVRHRVL